MNKIKLLDLVNEKIEDIDLCDKLIRSGKVLVNSEAILLPNILVEKQAKLSINYTPSFVSRGAYKLKGAIEY